MKPRPFGQAIHAEDIEGLRADSGPTDVVRLGGALIGAALADRVGRFTLPEITERISVPDGGVDARYEAPEVASVPETGGLVGPGRTVYQFKYRDARRSNRSTLVREIARGLRREFPRVAAACDRYVLLTNLDLSLSDRPRLRKTLLDGAPAFGSRPLVVWGATELKNALNQAPQLRHVFFADGTLCTLDFAEDELRASYRPIPWPSFVGRDRERGAVAAFVTDETTRVLQLVGARYAGKNRLILEALRDRGAAVVWASWPDAATPDLFRHLDSAEERLVLVVDRCKQGSAARITELGLERHRLKTIVIVEGQGRRVGSGLTTALDLPPLTEDQAVRLIRQISPGLPFLQQSWITKTAGGMPGLIVQVANMVARGEIDPRSEILHERLESLLVEKYLADMSAEQRRALAVVSLLPIIGVRDEHAIEVEEVARSLGTSGDAVRAHLPELAAAGLVQGRGGAVQVVPPVLAEHLAGEALARPGATLGELHQALPAAAFLRFLHRLRDLRTPGVTRALASVFSPDGWFPDLDSILRSAPALRALAPAVPVHALRCLDGVLGPVPAEELKERLTGDARRAVVTTLEQLALRSDTFEGAARLLLALAEAENESWGNNATGIFRELFHWWHPEVAAAVSRRAEILREGAASSRSPRRRRIVAVGCGDAFSSSSHVTLHEAEGPCLPEKPGRPQTWEEVRQYGLAVLTVCRSLSQDPVREVSDAARTAVIETVGQLVLYSTLPNGLHELGRRALSTLEETARTSPSARLWARIATQLELVLENLSAAPPQQGVSEARAEAERLLESLTSADDLRARLWRWVGPSSPVVDGKRLTDDPEFSSAIESLVGALMANPAAFADHVEWLTSEESEHRVPLFVRLGEADQGGPLLSILVSARGGSHWPVAFAAYCLGWAHKAPEDVDSRLDRLLEESTAHAGVLLAATWLPPSERAADRLIRLAAAGVLSRREVAREVARSLRWEKLSPVETERLLRALDDETPEVRSELLQAWLLRDGRGAELTPPLRELAWSFLEAVPPVAHPASRNDWDMLAKTLGKSEPGRLLALLEQLIAASAADPHGPLDRDVLPRVWSRIETTDRGGLLRMLLRIAAAPEAPWPVAVHLSRLIDPERDRHVLLEWVEQMGSHGALVLAGLLDAGRPGFWELARELVARWGDEVGVGEELQARLHAASWTGSAVEMIEGRIADARRLADGGNARVAAWAREALRQLEEWRRREQRQDREDWIWDYRVSRAQLEAMLAKKDTPERLWAIERLLENAPRDRVLELLSPAEIVEALPKLTHLDPEARGRWEPWARQWSEPR